MKHFISILLILFAFNLNAQRDTLDYHLATDTDTITYTVGGGDTTFYYIDTINERFNKHFYESSLALLDSIYSAYSGEIESLEAQVEAIHLQFVNKNTLLWNLRKQVARIEDLYFDLYSTTP